MWRASRYHFIIVIVPSFLLLGSTVIRVVTICNTVRPQIFTAQQAVTIAAVQQSLALLIQLIVTSLVCGRIAWVWRMHIQTMGKSDISSRYLSIISMLAQSFALDFIWTTISIATSFSKAGGPEPVVNTAFNNLSPFIQIIADLLVVYRVCTGPVWEKDTEEKLSSLQWNRSEEKQTVQLTSTTHSTQASICISAEVPDAPDSKV
ncbi:hypothetical protein NP233_g10153 [Leucocoprinus birnbaumii]|uniref:Uncharacterized protein n=1 Tax=Leucocoprinus birnbaumii TaxID=56174 RepID=A0AAD5YLK5_9AGAR|nr:hypothetical protein NP233_g10153 [Leucocoprinus birnbaumii]